MTLKGLAKHLMAQGFKFPFPASPVVHTSEVTAIVVFRDPPFQAQLVILKPNGVLPSHRHPNVDSYELPVAGDGHLEINGRERRLPIRIRPQDFHGGRAGPEGFMFLSVQRWENGIPPTDVGTDWIGEPIDEIHAEILRR